MRTKITAVRLSAEGEQLLTELAKHLGLNKKGVIETALRDLAEKKITSKDA
jgi:predicted DNA-binding protein